METKETKKRITNRRKPNREENQIRNSSLKPQNKYVEAALKNQGSFIVYDPNFML